jgi:hypothetical protein
MNQSNLEFLIQDEMKLCSVERAKKIMSDHGFCYGAYGYNLELSEQERDFYVDFLMKRYD